MNEKERYTVMIVEDDPNIRRFTAINLERCAFIVAEAGSGEEALAWLDTSPAPDFAVLDVMLPGMDGFELCRRIREKLPDLPIILLTARGQDMDKIMGLEFGADDYMVKPFNPLELIARIRAVLRRTSRGKAVGKKNKALIESGPFLLNLQANQLYNASIPVELTPKEFQLIKVLLEHSGQALSRDELLNLAWGADFAGEPKTVDVHIRRLREKLEQNASNPEFIETVWGFGYRWRGAASC